MTAAFITSAAELARVPDGTVISWLRIPGDHTSEAVAFVRHETEQRTDLDGRPMAFGTEAPGELPGMMTTVWISPGGWDPMSIEDAGVNFPATVIRWGEVTVSEEPLGYLPALTLDSGGTWAREKALEAAARLFTGAGVHVDDSVLRVADRFVGWLKRDDETLAQRLHAAADAIDEARNILGPTAEVGLKVQAVRNVATQWETWMARRTKEDQLDAYSRGYETGHRDGGSSATVDWQGEIERAREIAEDQMVADLRQLTNGDPKDPTFVSIGLAMSRRGWLKIEPTEDQT